MDPKLKLKASLNRLFFWRLLILFFTNIPNILNSWQRMDIAKDQLKADKIDTESVFDFIIVGGGTAGSVLANRLSENFKVLVLEAGGEPHPIQSIPHYVATFMGQTNHDYNHLSVPQKYSCLSQNDRRALLNQGKMLGGTSSLNYLIYLKGHPYDFDNWGRLVDSSWSYKNLIKYIRKIENYIPSNNAKSNPAFHGKGGQINVVLPDWRVLEKEWIQAGKELGYENVDLNGGYDEGFDGLYCAMNKGKRTVFVEYLQKIRKRKNLFIYKFSTATKILFKGPHKQAYAVKYTRHGKDKIAFATKEIIVSGGTILSPKLLMLSGIGPYDHLSSLNIPVISNRPTGQNLQDHIAVYLEGKSFISNRDSTFEEYAKFAFGRGALSSTLCTGVNWLVSSYAKMDGEAGWPDIVMYMCPFGMYETFADDFGRTFNLRKDITDKYYKPLLWNDSFIISITNARPRSKGQILLKDSDPNSELLIDPNYYGDPRDINAMMEGIRIAFSITENTTAFQALNTKYSPIPHPDCEHLPFRSDAYFECHIRSLSISFHHLVGTCAMGPANSPAAVVDQELRVIGVTGLRVIDASIQPKVVVTNTMASTLMIAEKGADMIKQYWLYGKKSNWNRNPFLAYINK